METFGENKHHSYKIAGRINFDAHRKCCNARTFQTLEHYSRKVWTSMYIQFKSIQDTLHARTFSSASGRYTHPFTSSNHLSTSPLQPDILSALNTSLFTDSNSKILLKICLEAERVVQG